ncbi:hypothetical protein [Novipirellula rosea]
MKALAAAQSRREQAIRDQAAAAEAVAQQEADLVAQQQRIADARAKLERQAREIEQAELEVRRKQAEIPAERVDLATATDVAGKLHAAFENYRHPGDEPEQVLADAVWDAVDDARDRLLTDDVDDQARALVLAINGVTMACERWELCRSGQILPASGIDLDTAGLGSSPATSRRVESLEKEMLAVLSGEQPPKTESIGRLVGEGIDTRQICKMIRLVNPDGSSALGVLGQIIDSGDRAQPSWEHVRWFGTLDFDTAWERRQADIPRRKQLKSDHYAASAHGSVRPNRLSGQGVVSKAFDAIEDEGRQFAAYQAANGI